MSYTLIVRPECIFSERAKDLLTKLQVPFTLKVIQPENKELEFSKLRKEIGEHNTFPLVFYGKKFIGGFTDLEKFVKKRDAKIDLGGIRNRKKKEESISLVIPKAKEVKRTSFVGSPYYSYIAMIYLSKKHRNCCVVFPINKPPERHEELSLRWNEKLNKITVPDNFWEAFTKCNGNKRFIVFPFGFSCCKKSGHANYIIYDVILRTMERFEPHGDINEILDKSMLKCVDAPVDDALIKLFKENLGENFISKYYKPLEFCPQLGFQTLQEKDEYKKYDPSGFCSAWSCWYADLRLLNPDVKSKNLIVETISALKKSPRKLTDFIRNYSQFIVDASKYLQDNEIHCVTQDNGSYCSFDNIIVEEIPTHLQTL